MSESDSPFDDTPNSAQPAPIPQDAALPNPVVEPVAVAAPVVKLTRDQIRGQIFNTKSEEKHLTLWGVPVVLKDPTMDVILSAQNMEDRKLAMVQLMVNYTYTEDGEPVFEESDVDGILQLPFNKDMREMQQEIQRMLGVMPTPETKSTTTE